MEPDEDSEFKLAPAARMAAGAQIPRKGNIMNRPELFLIPHDMIDVCGRDLKEILASYKDMKELGIAHLPYHEVDVGLTVYVYGSKDKVNLYICSDSKAAGYADFLFAGEVKFRYRDDECYQVLIKPDCPTCKERRMEYIGARQHHHEWYDILESEKYDRKYFAEAEKFKQMLIVLLASKNVVKTRTKDKLAALGIGKGKRDNHRPIYTTTLSLPGPLKEEREAKGGQGITLRAHLRRGHIRRQKYGPGCEFTKSIWIEPCFVNADENFVSGRSAYNASIKNMQGNPGNEQDMQKL